MQQDFDDKYNKAIALAVQEHKSFYGEYPYICHLLQVERTIQNFLLGDPCFSSILGQLRIAAILHDILEDTQVSKSTLDEMFGHEIADIVFAVTNESGKNRAEKFEKTSVKIRGNALATILKLADRISNYTNCIKQYNSNNTNNLLKMYDKESARFKELIQVSDYTEYGIGDCILNMWEILDILVEEGKYCLNKIEKVE